MKPSLKIAGFALLLCTVFPQTFAQMQVEKLNRGLIAVRRTDNHYLSWRLLANEPYTTGFNVYRGSTLLNDSPITGATIYIDNSGAAGNVYTVRPVADGVEGAASENARVITNLDDPNAAYFDIGLQRPPTGKYGGTYTPNDGSAGDLDGDGEYEIIIKWDPSNSIDNGTTITGNNSRPCGPPTGTALTQTTDNVIIDAYKLDGTRLWRIDLGENIRAGAHYTQFLVYDFDGDGKAEIMMKTAEGTKDGTGNFLSKGPAAQGDHSAIRRSTDTRDGTCGRILSGPEYLTVFNGETGAEMATIDYNPPRGNVSDWNDSYGNRVDRFNAAVAYLDGQRPSAVFNRGYYDTHAEGGRMTLWAVDWRNNRLTEHWFFDSRAPGNNAYAGQGNHQMSVADVDNSGHHSIITGSAVIKYDGTGYHTTGFGHGDALHVAHMIKGHPTPQIFMPHEQGGNGISLRHASDGTMIFNKKYAGDIGRGVAAPFGTGGWYFWSSAEDSLFDIAGRAVGTAPRSNTITHVETNFLIWWDGNLDREYIIRERVSSWNPSNSTDTRLLNATGAITNNGTKRDPVLTADLFGDWREELIFRISDNAIRVWTTVMPTNYRLVTMMHDPTYRVAVAWQNSSYNQPPHPGYYIAGDMDFPPPTLNVTVVGDKPPTTPVRNNLTVPAKYALNVTRSGKGTIKVNYEMKERGAVRIDLFNIKGERVKTAVNASKEAGTHQMSFSTNGLAAGMYLVQLCAGQITLRERVTIAK